MTVNILNATNSWEFDTPTETETQPPGDTGLPIVSAPAQPWDMFVLEGSAAQVADGNPNRLTLEGLSDDNIASYGPGNYVSLLNTGPEFIYDIGQSLHLMVLDLSAMATIYGVKADLTFSIIDGPGPTAQHLMTATSDMHGGTYLTMPPSLGPVSGPTLHLVGDPLSNVIAHGLGHA